MLKDDEMHVTDCNDVKLRLGRLHDGELDGDESARIEEHLRDCRSCSGDFEELRSLDVLIDAGLPEDGLDSRVAEQIGTGPAPGWWLGAAAAAVVLLALGATAGGLLFNGHAELQPAESRTASLIEDAFGPGSLRGIDDLARDLDQEAEGD